MGIFARLGTLIKSNINDLISKAEDPEKMLNQVLVDMKQQLVEPRDEALRIGCEIKKRCKVDRRARNSGEDHLVDEVRAAHGNRGGVDLELRSEQRRICPGDLVFERIEIENGWRVEYVLAHL